MIDCMGAITVEFSFFDPVCQIGDACTATIFVADITPPTPICPPDVTINATNLQGTQMIQDWVDSFTSTDDCSAPVESLGGGFIVPSTLCNLDEVNTCLLYTSPSPRDLSTSRMPSSA